MQFYVVLLMYLLVILINFIIMNFKILLFAVITIGSLILVFDISKDLLNSKLKKWLKVTLTTILFFVWISLFIYMY